MFAAPELLRQPLPRTACVLDGTLALGSFGLRAAAALCGEVEVWIPRRLHRTLRDPCWRELPAALVPRYWAAGARDLQPLLLAETARAEHARWERRKSEPSLASLPLRSLDDRADECSLPPGVDAGLAQRCEELERGLEHLAETSGYDLPRGRVVIEHAVDALALCAALAPAPAVVLTRMDPDGYEEPVLAAYLRAWKLPVFAVPARGGRAAADLRAVVARAGLLPLRWTGMRLVAVHVIAKDARILGSATPALHDEAAAAVWKSASFHWHEV